MNRLITFLALAFALTASTAVRAESADAVRADIESVILTIPDAWNQRNADAYAAAFTDPHDYVAVNGLLIPGNTREASAQGHARLWQTLFANGSHISFEIVDVALLSPSTALAIVKNLNEYKTRDNEEAVLNSVITMVLIDTEEGWRIRQFNNNLSSGFEDRGR